MTKLLGVIGDPIAHSLSPLIHNGWLRDMGIDAVYEAMQVAAGDLPNALKTLSDRDILGVNVTLPHKTDALAAAVTASEAAVKIGAANTLSYQSDDNWSAENTDAPGFLSALGSFNPDTDSFVIFGAGGSARALVYALSERGAKVAILNRTVSKAKSLAGELGNQHTVYASIDQYTDFVRNASIVINTTSMGYSGQTLNLEAGKGRLFFDISYGKAAAQSIAQAQASGWQTRDGLTMLVAQAALSFEIWFGEAPDLEAGLRRCRLALEAAS